MPRNLLFIINPNAGKKTSGDIVKYIHKNLPPEIKYKIVIWEIRDQFQKISALLHSGEYTDAIAVGGDGTVNRVASALTGTGIRLGIVPRGSGNGLARSLGLSMEIGAAINQILDGRNQVIDSGIVNGEPFFCTSGVGFDAHIAWLFAQSKSRGLQSYVKITIGQLLKYQPKEYTLELNGQRMRRKAFLITVANAGQYGNNVFIAPEAKLNDGLFHVVVVKPFHILQLPLIFLKVLMKKAHTLGCVETYTTSELSITRDTADSIHFDGEPHMAGKQLNYSIKNNLLHVIVGPYY